MRNLLCLSHTVEPPKLKCTAWIRGDPRFMRCFHLEGVQRFYLLIETLDYIFHRVEKYLSMTRHTRVGQNYYITISHLHSPIHNYIHYIVSVYSYTL
jgi:hypothetical protein